MICPTCKIICTYICPNCFESTSSKWHLSDDAKQFKEKQQMTQADKMEFQSKFKKGVSLIHKFDKSLWYSVQCECGDNECGSIVEIECDNEFGLIQLHFYKEVRFDHWRYPEYGFFKFNWFRRFLYRWKKAIILAFTGKIKLHGDFLLTDPEHINNFIEALQEGRDYCIKVKEKLKPEIGGANAIGGYNIIEGFIGDSGKNGVAGESGESLGQDLRDLNQRMLDK